MYMCITKVARTMHVLVYHTYMCLIHNRLNKCLCITLSDVNNKINILNNKLKVDQRLLYKVVQYLGELNQYTALYQISMKILRLFGSKLTAK